MKLSFLLAFCLLVPLAAQTASKNPFVTLDAEHIQYESTMNVFSASENVSIHYKSFHLQTSELEYQVNTKVLNFSKLLTVSRKNSQVTLNALTFSLESHSGEGHSIQAKLDHLHLKAQNISVTPYKITLSDSSFTTCENDTPHYFVASKKIELYPSLGFFVAFDNWVHISNIPFAVWIPTYVYGNAKYGAFSQMSSLPQFGASNREGAYIRQRIGYFLSPLSSGTLELAEYEKLGLSFGVKHQFLWSPLFSTTFEAVHVGKDGFKGGAEAAWNISNFNELNSWENTLFQTNNNEKNQMLALFKTGVRWNELILDSRVDKSPFLGLELQKPIQNNAIHFEANLEQARITERPLDKAPLSDNRFLGFLQIGQTLPLFPFWNTDTGFTFFMNHYSENGTWKRGFVYTASSFDILFSPTVSFTKKLFRNGQSPFYFEQQFAQEEDELGLKLKSHLNGTEIGLATQYVIEKKQLRNLDISAGLVLHCWKLTTTLNLMTGQFLFGIDLYTPPSQSN